MKIAVPVKGNNQVDEHFGHCEFYNVFTISENNEIQKVEKIESVQGCGCKSNISFTLAQMGVTVMLAGGIGGGAINVLNSVGIDVVRGCSGDSTEVVKQFITGKIADSGESCKRHEEHHHNHDENHVCNH